MTIYVERCIYHGGRLPIPDYDLKPGDDILCPGCEAKANACPFCGDASGSCMCEAFDEPEPLTP